MTKKLNKIAKIVNKDAIEHYISTYQTQTKNAVENIIQMSLTVKEIQDKIIDGVLEEQDLDYFCTRVGLNKTSSAFRKLSCIARHADKFLTYIDKLPSASSVLYEITTLDPEVFEKMINDESIHPFITLNQLKIVSKKIPDRNVNDQPVNILDITVKFDVTKISGKTIELIAEFYESMMSQGDAEVFLSKDKFQQAINFRQQQLKIAA